MSIHQTEPLRPGAGAPAAHAALLPARADGGAYGWLTPYIARIAAHNGDIAARALALRRAELHFIALTLALTGARADDPDHLAAFARALSRLPRRRILEAFAPEADARLAGLCGKLAGRPWRRASYVRLAALWAEPHARKVLAHLPAVTRRHVAVLTHLPEPVRTRGVLKMIRRRRDLAQTLFAIELVRRIRTDLDDRQILASLEKADSALIRDWVMRHYERVPFPPAPTGALIMDGVEALRPLTCFDDLARAAREFNNCIRDYLWRVLRGDAYFYRYAPEAGGKGVAIVELRRVPAIGWVVHEALGPNNDAITGAARTAVVSAFRDAGVGPAPQAASPYAWFELE